MVSEFGKYLRILRIQKGVSAKEMANAFGVTVSYLSAVETGKRSIPNAWIKKIVDGYNLSSLEKKELIESIQKSTDMLHIDLKYYSKEQRELIWAVCKEKYDKEKIEKILKELEN